MAISAEPVLDRDTLAYRTALLRAFLRRFGIDDFAELAHADGGWGIGLEEDVPQERFIPDPDSYLGVLNDILRRGCTVHSVKGYVAASKGVPERRRVWLEVFYDKEEEEWFYEFPGDRDDSDLDDDLEDGKEGA